MIRQRSILIALIALALVSVLAGQTGAQSAAAPASRPSDATVARWLKQLADDDADVRAAASESLMGLGKDDLPRLHDATKAQSPLLPEQLTSLRDIVNQVFLSGYDDLMNPPKGFVGLYWPRSKLEVAMGTMDSINTDGLPVVERIPGFPAYRLLRPGDLITAVLNRPDINVHSERSFISGVGEMDAGDVLQLQVFRGGQTIEIFLTLARRPSQANGTVDPVSWTKDRQSAADNYWKTDFADVDPKNATETPIADTQP